MYRIKQYYNYIYIVNYYSKLGTYCRMFASITMAAFDFGFWNAKDQFQSSPETKCWQNKLGSQWVFMGKFKSSKPKNEVGWNINRASWKEKCPTSVSQEKTKSRVNNTCFHTCSILGAQATLNMKLSMISFW